MGEWKRVFLNPARMGLLLLLTGLTCALFAGSLLTHVGPGELERTVAIGKYKGELTERFLGKDPLLIMEACEAEEAMLTDVYYDYNHFPRWNEEGRELPAVYADEASLRDAIAHLPYLQGFMGDVDRFNETLWMYIDALHEVNEDAAYAEGYTAYLQKIQKQTEEQSKTSIFGKENSFSLRNLKKTAREFGRLLGFDDAGTSPGPAEEGTSGSSASGVQVRFGNNRGIERWLGFRLGDYFGLLLLLVFVMAFLEERKKGLWSVIRTTGEGRLRLGIHRVLILLMVSVLSTLLLQLLPLGISLWLNGGGTDLSRPIQSIQSFRTCTVRCTIGGWILLYVAVTVFSGLLLGLFMWFLMGVVQNTQLALAALLPVLGAEYALFTFLPVQSILNPLKYLNLFSYVHTTELYTNYLNINLFGFPMGNRRMMLILLPVLLVLFCLLCLRMQVKRYPEGNRDLLSGVALKMNTVLDALRRCFGIGIWEAYKVLFLQYGAVILVILVLATGSLRYAAWSMIPEDMRTYYMYVRDMEGPLGEPGTPEAEESAAYLARARESAANSANPYELLRALDMLEERITALRTQGAAEGFSPWILYEPDFNAYYGEVPVNHQRLNAMLALLFMVFLCAGISAYERQAGVVPMLRSLKYGRSALFHRKLLMTFLMAVFVWGFVWLRELSEYISLFGKEILSAPVQNLPDYEAFPFPVSIRGFFGILYGLRLVMLLPAGYVILCLSSYMPNVRMSYLLGPAVLVLPALLVILGITVFRWVSPLIPVSAAELLLGLGQGRWWCVLPFVVWLAAGHAALKISLDRAM